MYEALKFAGAAAWFVGIGFFLFGNQAIGAAVLLFAAVMAIVSLMRGAKAREARRQQP